jgi:hypothetical protein
VRKGFVISALVFLILAPAGAAAEYAEARAESVVRTNNGETIIRHEVSVATGGGGWRRIINIRPTLTQLREELKLRWQERLGEIKDARKKQILERVNNRICEVNKNRMRVAVRHLDRISEVIDRVASRSAQAKANGKDTTGVEAAVTVARQKVTEAREAIAVQEGRSCTLTITGVEEKLGEEISEAVKAFEKELMAVHQKMKDARFAAASAVQKLAMLLGVEIPPKLKEGE